MKRILIVLLSVGFMQLGAFADKGNGTCANIFAVGKIRIAGLPFLKVSKTEALQSISEKRGFVEVPLDWFAQSGPRIEVFYRLLNPSETQKPILVFLNGGPASSSSSYVSLDGTHNSLISFMDKFRVLVIDQRGTGFSAPLDLGSLDLDAVKMARLLGAKSHARDSEAVLGRILRPHEDFFLLSHSYGSQILFHYLTDANIKKLPKKVIIASPLAPYVDSVEVFLARRQQLGQLNKDLLGNHPDLKAKIIKVKERIRREEYVDSFGTKLQPEFLSIFFQYLDPKDPTFHSWLDGKLNEFLDPKTSIAVIGDYLLTRIYPIFNSLNYVLSSTELLPGYTDAMLVEITDKLLEKQQSVFLSWMFNEGDVILNRKNIDIIYGGKLKRFLLSVDSVAIHQKQIADLNVLKARLQQIPSLFITGTADPISPFSQIQLLFDKIRGNSQETTFVAIPEGVHTDSLSENSVKIISDWVFSK